MGEVDDPGVTSEPDEPTVPDEVRDEEQLRRLRARAEELARQRADATDVDALSAEELRAAIHELRVHQIELELQNEELQSAQAQLEAARLRYRDLYENAPVGYCTVSDSGQILEANLTLAALLGVERGALSGEELTRFIDRDSQDAYYLARKREAAGARGCCELQMRRSDGGKLWVRLEMTLSQDPDGVPVWRHTVSDISETVHTQEELQRMQRMEVVGSLAAGIAHDFNNLLMGLFGNVSLAKSQLPEGHAAERALDRVEEAMDRATRLTGQLLTFSKGGEPVRTRTCIASLVESAVRLHLAGRSLKPVFDYQDSDLWWANVDPGQLEQVVSNLVINADEASPEGGSLHVSMRNVEITPADTSILELGRYVSVSVRDEGAGISASERAKVFDPFFSTKASGSGLGLATSYAIVAKHGGAIRLESELGVGTTVTVYLPACDASVEPAPASSEAMVVAGKQASDARVLIMDDEEMIRDVYSQLLAEVGFTVDSARDGAEAIEIYRGAITAGAPFDLVILDLTVPGGMGGMEAVRKILELDSTARVVVSSGYADDPVMARYTEYGFKGVVRKPCSAKELLSVVRTVLG
jgi:PAS domain S-box-containing protein